MEERINLDQPRWDQSTYLGRCRHFFQATDPRNILATTEELNAAKKLVDQYKAKEEPAGVTEDELWKAKKLVDSAFHPDTGELMFLPGRMSFQVPGNMTIVGCMLAFYRTTPAVIFWQWVNQSFNAVVNYTNRNASAGITDSQLATAYFVSTTASVTTAVGLNRWIQSKPSLQKSFIGRLVPLCAVAAANCVNIPAMRFKELESGIEVKNKEGEVLGKSKKAAARAVGEVIPSRIAMAIPGMAGVPACMHQLEATALLMRLPILAAPLTVLINGAFLCFSTPTCCALFPQNSTMGFDSLEPELQQHIREKYTALGRAVPSEVFYNKGL